MAPITTQPDIIAAFIAAFECSLVIAEDVLCWLCHLMQDFVLFKEAILMPLSSFCGYSVMPDI